MSEDSDHLVWIAGNRPHTSKTYKGFYDTSILCADCEKKMAYWDDYGIKFFQDSDKWEKITGSKLTPEKGLEQKSIYVANGYDVAKLKLFFISILWRAHVSQLDVFKRVKLGPYADKALTALKNEDPGDEHEFSTILFKFTDSADVNGLHLTLMDPIKIKMAGLRFYQFQMIGFGFNIKVDNRRVQPPLLQFCLKVDGPIYVLERDFDDSKEKRAMFAAFRQHIQAKDKFDKVHEPNAP